MRFSTKFDLDLDNLISSFSGPRHIVVPDFLPQKLVDADVFRGVHSLKLPSRDLFFDPNRHIPFSAPLSLGCLWLAIRKMLFQSRRYILIVVRFGQNRLQKVKIPGQLDRLEKLIPLIRGKGVQIDRLCG